MANTLSVEGHLYRKVNNVTELDLDISPSASYTEYTENHIAIGTSASQSINLWGLSYPQFLYMETDRLVTFKAFRAGNVVASALPVNSSLLLTGSSAYRYGTITVTNVSTASTANISIYMC